LTEQNLQYVNDIAVDYENKNNQIKILALENETVRLRLEKKQKSITLHLISYNKTGYLSIYNE
jgi:hypothetical protein